MEIPQLVVYIATFVAVTSLLTLCLGYLARYDSQIDERLADLSPRAKPKRLAVNRPLKSRQTRDARAATPQAKLALRLLSNSLYERQRLQARLMNAGIYSAIALPLIQIAILLLTFTPLAAAAVACVCGWVQPWMAVFWGSLVAGIGMLLPSLWLRQRKRKWHAVIGRSLSDFLDLMVSCMEAGLSAEAALQRVTEELRHAHPRLSAELSVVQAQIELGVSSDAALKNFADRSDCDAIRAVATVVQQGRRLGGGMADVFRQQAESLRTRREYAAEEKAQQAAVKILIPTLLFIFPVIFVVLAGPAVIKLAVMFSPNAAKSRPAS